MNQLRTTIGTKQEAKRCLTTFNKEYNNELEPGNYLYSQLLSQPQTITKERIKLIYTTLIAWRMNTRGAKLADFEPFQESILNNKTTLKQLRECTLADCDSATYDEKVIPKLHKLFLNLQLVGTNKSGNEKPRLVTYSKALHFLLPDLVVPVDRQYTLMFYKGHTNISSNVQNQFALFAAIQQDCQRFAQKAKRWHLQEYCTQKAPLPKLIDNLIIGYQNDAN